MQRPQEVTTTTNFHFRTVSYFRTLSTFLCHKPVFKDFIHFNISPNLLIEPGEKNVAKTLNALEDTYQRERDKTHESVEASYLSEVFKGLVF